MLHFRSYCYRSDSWFDGISLANLFQQETSHSFPINHQPLFPFCFLVFTLISITATSIKMGSVQERETFQKIRLVRTAHVYYKHKNIDAARQFLVDFGFLECKRIGNNTYYRGYSNEPFLYCAIDADEDTFGGAAFVVESEQDLILASKTLPNASKIYQLTDAPGGGQCVTFQDPVDGFPFHLVHGQTLAEDETALPELQFNFVILHLSLSRFQC